MLRCWNQQQIGNNNLLEYTGGSIQNERVDVISAIRNVINERLTEFGKLTLIIFVAILFFLSPNIELTWITIIIKSFMPAMILILIWYTRRLISNYTPNEICDIIHCISPRVISFIVKKGNFHSHFCFEYYYRFVLCRASQSLSAQKKDFS